MMTNADRLSSFLPDFLAFLHYIATHRVRVTTLNRHIPLRHLKDLAAVMRGKEPFHPLHSAASYEMRCQRDQARLDFMDMLAEQMALLERSDWGYIQGGPGWDHFMGLRAEQQSVQCWMAYWAMDWNSLFPWVEVVDALRQDKLKILGSLKECRTGETIPLIPLSETLFPGRAMATGFFWVIIRPLEFLDLATSAFAQDAQGFWYPQAFALNEMFYAMPSNVPP